MIKAPAERVPQGLYIWWHALTLYLARTKTLPMRASLLVAVLLHSFTSSAQTTLFSEDFEGTPDFTLNTSDAASVISTWNTWVVNNSYTGGDGDVICLGFPFTYTIINTPAQPAGITTPNGNYLHTASVEGINDGITNCSFGAADGFCITADNTFSRMSTDVSTLGSAGEVARSMARCIIARMAEMRGRT